MHNALQELVTPPAPAPAAVPDVRPGSAPAGNTDIPGLPAKTSTPEAPASGAAPADPGLEFDLTSLGLAETPGDAPSEAVDMTTTRGQQIWADHKLMRALEQPPDKGGIGYRPTLEQVRNLVQDAQAHNNLILDLQSTTKAHNISAINWLLRAAPQAFLDLAANLPPDMAKLARERLMGAEIEALLETARKFPTDNDQNKAYRNYWFQVANGLHYALTGGQSLDPQVLLRAPQPKESEDDRLRRREEEVTQRERAQFQQQFDSWKSGVITRRETAIRDMVTQVVKPVRASESVKSLAIDAIVSRTLSQLPQQTAVMDQVTNLLRRAEGAISNPDLIKSLGDQIVDLYIRAASPIIRQQVAESIKQTTNSVAEAASADAAKAKQATGDPVPAGSPTAPGGAPQTGQPGQPRARQKGETDQQYIQSVISDRLRN